MLDLTTILLTISALLILESLTLLIFPTTISKIFKDLSKNKSTIKNIGLIELILAIILIIASFFYNTKI